MEGRTNPATNGSSRITVPQGGSVSSSSSSSSSSAFSRFMTARQALASSAAGTGTSNSTTSTAPTSARSSSTAATATPSIPIRNNADYQYLNLKEAEKYAGTNQHINLYGIVIDFYNPNSTKGGHGSEYIFKVSLIDPTRPSADSAVHFNLFFDVQQLPRVRKTGDILRLHRVQMDRIGSTLKGSGGVKYGLSAVVISFPGGEDVPSQHLSTYSELVKDNFTIFYTSRSLKWSPSDEQTVMHLRNWYLKQLQTSRNLTRTAYDRPLASIREGSFGDFICMLVSYPESTTSPTGKHTSAWLWDGTRSSHIDLPEVCHLMENSCPPLTDQPLTAKEQQAIRFLKVKTSDGIIYPVKYGSVLRFVAFAPHEQKLSILTPGTWVKIRNGKIAPVIQEDNKFSQLFLWDKSETKFLSKNDQTVQSIIDQYATLCEGVYIQEEEDKLHEQVQRVKENALVTTVDHQSVPVSSLHDILVAEETTMKYRCRVQIAAYYPLNVTDFVHPICPRCNHRVLHDRESSCRSCSTHFKKSAWVYHFQLRVRDESARETITVIVFGSNGEKFFGGLTASDVHAHESTKLRLTTAMKKLTRLGVWLDCCIKSYYIEGDPTKRRYQLFDTAIRDEDEGATKT